MTWLFCQVITASKRTQRIVENSGASHWKVLMARSYEGGKAICRRVQCLLTK